MDTLQAINRRHSTRSFQTTPVEREVLERIIDAGRQAPSASNQQPWEFVVIVDDELRRKVAELTDYGKFIAEAPACVAVFCRETTYCVEDGCAATENMLLAATDEGVHSCWVAGNQKEYAQAVATLLNAPANVRLISLVVLGYAQTDRGATPKRTLQDVIHWDRF